MPKVTPLYLYDSYTIPSPDDGALYHYTKFDAFLKILEAMSLRTSSLRNLNDLNEANIDSLDWNNDFLMMYKAHDYVKDQFSIISFSKNYIEGSKVELGSNHPAMWSHYADNSNGVCLVLDKNVLIENNQKLLSGRFFKFENIEYNINCAPKHGIEYKHYEDASDFVHNNYRELFFKKHIDWQYEDEERFLVESPEMYLDINGAIKFVVLGCRLSHDSLKLQRMLQLIISPNSKCYRYFNFHSFAEITTSVFGYLTVDAAYKIRDELTDMSRSNDEAKAYLEWHKNYFNS